MLNPLIRWFVSLAISAATFASLYVWKAHGVEPAGNLFLFWMWFVAALGCLLLFTPLKYAPKTTYPKLPFLSAFSLAKEIILIVLLVGFGNFILAAFSVIGLFGRYIHGSHYDSDGKLKVVGHA